MKLISSQSTRRMLEGVAEFGPTTRGDASGIARTRVAYARAGAPVGTMPPTEQSAAIEAALDKLGARLQFERSGTRLYEALVSKVDAYGTFRGGPTRDDLIDIRNDEHHHALLAQELIRALGGDPTMLTPCANLHATASRGLCDVLTDPRTTLVEGLDAIIVAELVDRESWDQLVTSLAAASVPEQLLNQVKAALEKEEEHLRLVRTWIAAARATRAGADT
ncbi:MAG: ferritin-like domain-containing protein [Deltaproteobacteria bacterium]|nr:ferritin-like domain-containing protein [Kofleriaceae bacterium]